MQQFSSLLSWCLFTAQHVSGIFPELNDCSDSLWFYLRVVVTVVLCLWSARPRTQHDCHHDTKVKPEAVAAVIELLMMGGETPETCWAINKRQYNKLENCCNWLVIYLNPYWSFKTKNYYKILYSLEWVQCKPHFTQPQKGIMLEHPCTRS
jgi:hypothetical protein